jgi:hypothetical protein
LSPIVTIVFDTNAKLSNAKFREIGRSVAHWSLLEYQMQLAIGRIIGTNLKTARILNYRAGTERLMERLNLVAEVHGLPKPSIDRLVRLLARIEKLKSHRNDVAHGLWGQDKNLWYLIQFKSPKFIKAGKHKRITANELRRTADRIETLTNAFDRWRLSLPTS